MNQENKTYTFHVRGMHCNSCVVLTESELKEHPKVHHAKSSLKSLSVEVSGEFGDATPQVVAQELTHLIKKHGYELAPERPKKKVQWQEFFVAIPIALLFAIAFILLQKIGFINLVNTDNVSYGTAFLIGIIASLSTCMAVVGGLVLSMSATFAKDGDRVHPQVLFHLGRIVSFFILGGAIGALGSAFQLGIVGTFILGMLIGLVMLLLGINLLDIFHWSKRFQPSMPKFISKRVLSASRLNHSLTPILVGILTFFLPCGFTQAMQIYTLSTGSFLQGGLTMLVFALGTLPVLALISFSSFSIHTSSKAGIFFKTAGLIIILFALFNILNSLIVIGLLPPLFNF